MNRRESVDGRELDRRLVVIGLDSLEWWDFERLDQAGLIPHISKLVSGANVVKLECDFPYRAESIWTEFFTGRTRDENKYWTTAVFDPATYDTWVQGAFRGHPFYARPDVVPVVLDLPHVPISPEARGIQVTAWGAHSPQFPTASLPSDVVPEIDRRFGVNPAMKTDSHAGWHNAEYQQGLADALATGASMKGEIFPWMLEREADWNFALTVFTEPHVSGHQFWHGIDPRHLLHGTPEAERARTHHDRVMSSVDDAVGTILRSLPDDSDVVLLAAHGMQVNGSDVTGGVLIAELLHRHHLGRPLIEFDPFDPSEPPLVLPAEELPIEYLADRAVEARGTMATTSSTGRAARRLASALRRRRPDLSHRLERLAWRVRGTSHRATWWEMRSRPAAKPFVDLAGASRLQPLDYQPPCWYRHRWPEMDTFVLPAFSDAHIRVNLVGREASGTVALADYERVLDETEALIRACVDARTGEPIVAAIYRPRLDDPMDPDGPTSDLVISFTGASDAIRHPQLGIIGPAPLMRSGEHTTNGWVARVGDQHSVADRAFAPSDVAPTLIDLAGLPPSPSHTGTSFADHLR